MMDSYNKATRKGLEGDRIAVCPQFGCETIERVKPLRFGILGLHKFPKCAVHKIPLVFVDEFIGDFLGAINACLFDISGMPPKDLIHIIRKQEPKYLTSFTNRWMYCSLFGRGAEMVPRYMDSLSTAYIKTLSKRQQKSFREQLNTKKKYKMLHLGLKKIEKEYIEFLFDFREKSENLYDEKEIRAFPEEISKLIRNWLKGKLENIKKQISRSESSEQNKSLSLKKEKYDKILQAGTCTLLLGKSPTVVTNTVSAYELFSGYREFLEAGLCQDITSIGNISGNLQKELDFNNKNINIHQQYSPDALDNMNDEEKSTPQTTFSVKIPEINIKDNDIKTRGWNYFKEIIYDIFDDNPPEIYKKVLRYSKEFIENYVKTIEPSILKNREVSIQTSFGRNLELHRSFLIRGDPYFEQILNNRLIFDFNWIVYKLKCNIYPFKNKVYIGWSKNSVEHRFREHILAAIAPRGRDYGYVSLVKLHEAIRESIEKEGIYWLNEWNFLEERIGTLDYKNRIDKLVEVVKRHFEVVTLEIHRNFNMSKKREKYYTLNYKNEDGTVGTIENGLNEITGGGGGLGRIRLPYLDIMAMVTLGKRLLDIHNTIISLYPIDITYSTFTEHVRDKWESFENLQEEFFKLIIERLIKQNLNYGMDEIAAATSTKRETLTRFLKKWYNGRCLEDLKQLSEDGKLDWEDLEYYNKVSEIKQAKEVFYQVPIWLLKKWLIEGRMTTEMGSDFGIYRKAVSRYITQHPLLGNNLYSVQEVRDNLRRETFINLLEDGWNPYMIIEDVFKIDNIQIRRFIGRLFSGKTLEEVIQEIIGEDKELVLNLGKIQRKILKILEVQGRSFLLEIKRVLKELTHGDIKESLNKLIKNGLVETTKEYNPVIFRTVNKYSLTEKGKKVLKYNLFRPISNR